MRADVRTYCSLCGVGCPSVVTVDAGRVLSLEPDRGHPLGGTTCSKGRAAPEMHDHAHRLNHPMRRTRSKTDPDPGWEPLSWDDALDLIATELSRIREESGPQAVAFGRGTPGGTGLQPAEPWVQRFARAFGSPNYMTNTHLCNWARDGASHQVFGEYPLPPPDVDRSKCILLWGANPAATRINLARSIVRARQRGARIVVVDPRRVGLGGRADVLLQVRPGTDAALALAFVHLLIENRWFDEAFTRDWSNAPFLVREDTGRLLRSDEVVQGAFADTRAGGETGYVAGQSGPGRLIEYVPALGCYRGATGPPALRGRTVVELRDGRRVRCRTVFDLLADEASRCAPEEASRITGVPEGQIHDALRMMVESRPVSHYVWNGIAQHTNATQSGRAIEIFYALLGDWDRPGGNVVQPALTTARIEGEVPLPPDREALRLGLDERPLGPPAIPGDIAAYDLFTAVLEARPYRVRALLSFGGNTLINSADPLRGREALRNLEFFAQAELFHTPTNHFADVILPVTSFLETDSLVITRAGRAERRRRAVDPLHERRSDVSIVFDLATRLGHGDRFAGGDVAAAYDEVLAPAGLTWEGLSRHPEGLSVSAAQVRYEKYAAKGLHGTPSGFATGSGRVELFADGLRAHDRTPLPVHEEPAESPLSTPELAREYPLVMTNAKSAWYLHGQHRGIAALRRRDPDPTVQIHPDTAARHGIDDATWVWIETPRARVRAKAEVTPDIVPGVVCANHGWWEGCEELGMPPLDPFSEEGANVNLLMHNDVRDPISGSVPNRSSLCRVRPLGDDG
ncbi:molybdopterin-dependent oxidoreductase [Streptomyces sp. NPDC051105]|uniref:molybdopterin-containing oxidoreductase family protein n=1 Tax=Streptomyces sp. NPDC051105 TaxID=3154843 RepID=UPI0034378671